MKSISPSGEFIKENRFWNTLCGGIYEIIDIEKMFFRKKKKKREVTVNVRCETCNGSGMLTRDIYKRTVPAYGSGHPCYSCGGSGSVTVTYYE